MAPEIFLEPEIEAGLCLAEDQFRNSATCLPGPIYFQVEAGHCLAESYNERAGHCLVSEDAAWVNNQSTIANVKAGLCLAANLFTCLLKAEPCLAETLIRDYATFLVLSISARDVSGIF
jgi:hypothetical protein